MPIVKKGEYGKYNNDLPTAYDGVDEEMIQMINKKIKKSKSGEPLVTQETLRREFDINSGNFKLKKSRSKTKSSKSNMIKEVQDSIKMVDSIKIPKKVKSKNISTVLDMIERVSKAPKTKKIYDKDIESINDSINEVDKLLKTPKKGLKKLIEADKEHLKYHPSKQDYKEMKMDQKAYKHIAKNVSDLVSNYVSHFKSILSENKVRGGVMTKALKAIRTKFYDSASPSEIDDANSLIKQYRELLPPKESKAVVPRAKKVKPDDNSYEGHKKYKPLTLYVKKHNAEITDPSDIDNIVKVLIDKSHPRMSVTKLNEVLEDLGFL